MLALYYCLSLKPNNSLVYVCKIMKSISMALMIGAKVYPLFSFLLQLNSPEEMRDEDLAKVQQCIEIAIGDEENLQLAFKPCSLSDVFFNTQTYQRHILAVYKLTVNCNVCRRVLNHKCPKLSTKCEEIFESLNKKLVIQKLPPYVQQLFVR